VAWRQHSRLNRGHFIPRPHARDRSAARRMRSALSPASGDPMQRLAHGREFARPDRGRRRHRVGRHLIVNTGLRWTEPDLVEALRDFADYQEQRRDAEEPKPCTSTCGTSSLRHGRRASPTAVSVWVRGFEPGGLRIASIGLVSCRRVKAPRQRGYGYVAERRKWWIACRERDRLYDLPRPRQWQ
jgi:hypothetical protein